MRERPNYEDRFYLALKQITAYMTPEQLGRHCEHRYGLSYQEALEMTLENVLGEARSVLRGYRRKKAVGPRPPQEALDEQTD